MSKKKVLIIQNTIPHYRIPLYNELSKKYELTVLHSGNNRINENYKFNEIIASKRKIWPFYFQNKVFGEIWSKKYIVIISMCDLHWINNIIAVLIRPKTVKYIFWGSWFSKNRIVNSVKTYLAKIADANLYYSVNHKEEFLEYSPKLESGKLFVANNTIDVGVRIDSSESKIKNILLFVGSLDKRKQLCDLINAFDAVIHEISVDIELIIIGSGDNYQEIYDHVLSLNLQDRVRLVGRINDPAVLRSYYLRAIVSISFGQAGLSVLQSLAFGVPFLTKKNAISGGEIYNIKHGWNGFLCEENISSLSFYIKKLCQDIELSRLMGKNAFTYYSENCTIEKMAKGFQEAITYSLNEL